MHIKHSLLEIIAYFYFEHLILQQFRNHRVVYNMQSGKIIDLTLKLRTIQIKCF